MGADLLTIQFTTLARRPTPLKAATFKKRARKILTDAAAYGTDIPGLAGDVCEDRYGSLDHGFDLAADEGVDQPEETDTGEFTVPGAVAALTSIAATGYDDLITGLAGRHRHYSAVTYGAVTFCSSGGTSFGDAPYDEWYDLAALIAIADQVPTIGALWGHVRGSHLIATVNPRYNDAIRYAAAHHPDPAVRAACLLDPAAQYTADDLAAAADDPADEVRAAVTHAVLDTASR